MYENTDEKYDEIVSLIKYFRNNFQAHVETEEAYMESIQYEEMEVQRLAHDIFITRLKLMNLDEFDITKQHELEEFVEFLTEWLITHIAHMDKRIGKT